jgi:hypothetical protein
MKLNLKKMLTPPKRWNPFWRELRAARDSALAEFEQTLDRVIEDVVRDLAVRGIALGAAEAEQILSDVRDRVRDELRAVEIPEGLSPGD